MELLHHAERRLIAAVARRPSTSMLRALSSVDLPTAPSQAGNGNGNGDGPSRDRGARGSGAPGGALIAGGLEGEEEAIERRWRDEVEQGEGGGPALFGGGVEEEGDEEGDWGQSVHF